MIEEIILKEFIASLFKNAVIKKYTDPLLQKGINKLRSIFKSKKKDALLVTLEQSQETPKELAAKHTAELNELLQDETFRSTAKELCGSPTIYASVVGATLEAAKDIALKLSGKGDHTATISNSIVDTNITSKEGGINLEINA